MPPNSSWHCSDAPHSIFPTSVPLYPFFPVSFSVVLPLTFRQSMHRLLCRWCSQMLPPPQSLHVLLRRWCSQMLLPPQSVHWLLSRWCSQMLLPPHSLHLLLRRWCSQNPLPPQSLHVLLTPLCSQMPLPPQSLHLLLTLWCSQRAGALRGFLAAEGRDAGAVATRPCALAGLPPLVSCLRRFPCGPPGPSSTLFLPAAAASGPSVWSDILLCGVSSVWRLAVQSVRCFHSRVVPLSMRSVSLDPTVTLLYKETILPSTERWRGRGNTRLSHTGRTYSKNVSLAPLLTLRHCQGDKSSSFSHDSQMVSQFCPSRGTLPRDCQKSCPPDGSLSLTFSLPLSRSLSISRSLALSLSLSLSLALSLFMSSQPRCNCVKQPVVYFNDDDDDDDDNKDSMDGCRSLAFARSLSPALSCSLSLAHSVSLSHSSLEGRSCRLSKVVSC